jgi:hypothetical protein
MLLSTARDRLVCYRFDANRLDITYQFYLAECIIIDVELAALDAAIIVRRATVGVGVIIHWQKSYFGVSASHRQPAENGNYLLATQS